MAKKKPAKSKDKRPAPEDAQSSVDSNGGERKQRRAPKHSVNVTTPPADLTHKKELFPIVGIGASAGGLAALKEFFAHVPADSGLAFVVVMHLSPEHKSHLPELLQPHIRMPVQQVTETLKLEPNHVYVIPPNSNLDTIDTHLRLTELEKHRQQRAPIDHFFRTLGKAHDGAAIGVVLTGTGSDGTLGLREIKENGGLTVVQDPAEAEYDGMPQSAIASGMVDLVLPLQEMFPAISRFARTAPKLLVPGDGDGDEPDGDSRQLLQKVFAQLRARTNRDFTRYKRATILRRIQRRMQLRQVEEVPHYLEILREQPDEVRLLADDLLITVTSFFRDAEVFEALEKDVIPGLFAGKSSGDEIRAWTVGCATGEEAYSLAMLLYEEAARRDAPPRLQIFASDLHEQSLKQARDGFYPGDIETDVAPDRLQRFFVKEDSGYRIRKEIRELVIFAPHNLLSDPPFSRVDLISCRNLLIYIQREVQRDIIELFHYALRADGILVLGTSETLDPVDLFRAENKKRNIYKKRNVPAPEPRLPVFPMLPSRLSGEPQVGGLPGEQLAYGQLHQRLVEQFGAPSVLISPDDRVVHLSNMAGRYLIHPSGELTANVYKLLRKELRIELRTLLHAVRKQKAPLHSCPITVHFDGNSAPVVLQLQPALDSAHDGFVLVTFEEQQAPQHKPSVLDDGDSSSGMAPLLPRQQELETELNVTHQRLQAIIEEHETSREEMKASNEELQSTNEELRSTMEELETSKEELQSMNEELQTVNQERRHKIDELAQLSSDLQNLLSATEIATLFLDRDLRIMRFTPKVSELFNVQMIDRGRPISDLTHRLSYAELQDDAARVLNRLVPMEREVEDRKGRWYLARVLPYRSIGDRIEGVVLTFIDITGRKQAESAVRESKEYAEHIIETLPEPLLVLRPDLTVKSANAAFYTHFKVASDATIGRQIWELGNGHWNIPALRSLLQNILPQDSIVRGYVVEHEFEDLGARVMVLNAQRLESMQLILLGIHDVTERHAAEQALRESEERLRQLATELDQRVHERTSELQESRQLEQSQRLLANVRAQQLQGLNQQVAEAEHKERRRLADVLHDHVQQELVAIQMRISELRDRVFEESVRETLAELRDLLNGTINTARELTVELVPPLLHDQGLGAALEWLGAQMGARHNLIVEVDADRQVEIRSEAMLDQLYQAARELLLNVAKHAGSKLAKVRLLGEDSVIVLQVSDRGTGFDTSRSSGSSQSYGLFSIRERSEAIGGTLKVESRPGEGTQVTIRVPQQ